MSFRPPTRLVIPAIVLALALISSAGPLIAADSTAPSGRCAPALASPAAYPVSGRVASAAGCGASGTVVRFERGESEVATALADSIGNYTVNLSEPGTYSVSCAPSGTTGCTFTPATAQAVVATGGLSGLNFTARGLRTIKGHVSALQVVSAKGITVRCQPWGSSAITDSRGDYVITDVPDGEFIVAPAKKGLAFAPTKRPIHVAGGEVTGVGFTASSLITIVIDAGHQARADSRTEPIGPGSKSRKPRVAGGATGAATHKPESLINLQVALKLRDELVKRGLKVVMVRTTQKVNLSNSKRAKIANNAHAALFIRLHCDSAGSSVRGVLTLVPAKNRWTSRIVKASARASRDIHRATVKRTRAKNRGISKRGDLSGFNWCKVPTTLVEMGLMSNHTEDRKLASAAYQRKLATGIAEGTVRFVLRK